MGNILEIRGLTMSYVPRHPAVEDVTLDVQEGENLCLLGANGSGKSTLIKGVLGLMAPDAGEVRLRCPRERVAYLSQMNTAERDFPATVREIVLSGTQRPGRLFYRAEDKKSAEDAMRMLRVDDLAARRIGDLSGGQQQRALLARAVARKPKLLILDEPCSALDPDITRELYELLDSLRRSLSLTMLLSTHDWEYAARYADRVAMMDCRLSYVETGAEFRARMEGGERK